MKLSILIATVGRRNDSFLELMHALIPQVEQHKIEIVAYWNTGGLSIGDIRQALLEEATGEYVCFIDDDDRVPDYYCDEIIAALGEDYVGFQVELFEKDREMRPVFHSIKYRTWYEDEQAYYRGVTHLNPIRRELAMLGNFGKTGAGEDATWAKSVADHVKTEKYIPKVMYRYYHDADNTHFGGPEFPPLDYKRPVFVHPQFRWHSKSKEKGKM